MLKNFSYLGAIALLLAVPPSHATSNLMTPYPFVTAFQSTQIDVERDSKHHGLPANAVIYGVIPGLLGHNGYRDLQESMVRLKAEGVDAIWVSPINQTDEQGSLLSYSVTDYFHLRTDFGSEDDFRNVVREAHRLGIKILMDFVANHTSENHPYFLDAEKKGKRSLYYDYYDRDDLGAVTHYFDWTNLKNLNYSNPAVSKMMERAFIYWVEQFGVDGFRVDAAWGVKSRAPLFWPNLRKALMKKFPDVILIAEASARDPYYQRNGFDLAYDWNDQLGHLAWENVFDDRAHIAERLHVALTSAATSASRVVRFINNNDTGDRFITRFGVGLTRVAAALQFTLPGVPVMYAGDEVGAEYQPYSSPAPIDWSLDPYALHEYYKNLIRVRKSTSAFKSEKWQPLMPIGNLQAYAFTRGEASSQGILAVFNFGSSDTDLQLALTEEFARKFKGRELMDLLTSEKVKFAIDPASMILSVHVSAETALVLRPAGRTLGRDFDKR